MKFARPIIRFTIPGQPEAWKRRGTRVLTSKSGKAFVQSYKTKAHREWKEHAQSYMPKVQPLAGPVAFRLLAVMEMPKSRHLKTRKRPREWYTGRMDLDNIVKNVWDAANGVLWSDDRQVCQLMAQAIYGEQGEEPRLEISLHNLALPEALHAGEWDE